MGYPDFIDQVLSDFTIYCDDDPIWDFRERLTEVEQDASLSFEERRDAILSLHLAALIDPSRDREEICRNLNRLRYQGYLNGKTVLVDYDKLGRAFWEDVNLPDDRGESCWIHYNDVMEEGPFIYVAGYMKAEEQDTADFLLAARVETFLNRLNVEEVAA